MSEQQGNGTERKPLWPKAIEVIGGTGEYESGKTTFGVTICPGPDTRVYDLEKSAGSYASDMEFDRVDVPAEMQKRFPNGYKPVDVFKWWIQHVQSIEPGTFRVIMVDPASDIEQGLADYVLANPKEFGRTPGQYLKMAGLMWGDMKAKWKMILADLAARCETFYFTTHMGSVWKGDRPSRERKAKGKETLFEMASLYLRFERKKDVNAVPSAVVLKSRLSKMNVDESSEEGEVISIPLLPPRLPKATPAAVRRYMNNPPDYSNLKQEEMVGENKLTEDEKLLLRAEIANAERDTAMVGAGNEPVKRFAVKVGTVEPVSTTETESSHGEQVEEALADAATVITSDAGNYPSPDARVGAGLLGSLRQAIARFKAAYPNKHDSITRGIAKRNPKAKDESELTNGQAEDMEASLLRILNGPHGADDRKGVASKAKSKS